MNRVGFGLLTLGVALAFLGWYYQEGGFAAAGFAALIVLTALAAVWPELISYDPLRESQPLGVVERRIWGAIYLFALLMTGVAFLHTAAGGHGEVVIVAGLAMFASLGIYDGLHQDRFRAWRTTGRGARLLRR